MAHRINHELMKDLESRTFESFGQLAIFLRERTGMNREDLGRALGYARRSACAVVGQVEQDRKLAGTILVARYVHAFDIEPGYAAALAVEDASRRILSSLPVGLYLGRQPRT